MSGQSIPLATLMPVKTQGRTEAQSPSTKWPRAESGGLLKRTLADQQVSSLLTMMKRQGQTRMTTPCMCSDDCSDPWDTKWTTQTELNIWERCCPSQIWGRFGTATRKMKSSARKSLKRLSSTKWRPQFWLLLKWWGQSTKKGRSLASELQRTKPKRS